MVTIWITCFFNSRKLYILPTECIHYVFYDSHKKRVFPSTALTGLSSLRNWNVFPVRYELSSYITVRTNVCLKCQYERNYIVFILHPTPRYRMKRCCLIESVFLTFVWTSDRIVSDPTGVWRKHLPNTSQKLCLWSADHKQLCCWVVFGLCGQQMWGTHEVIHTLCWFKLVIINCFEVARPSSMASKWPQRGQSMPVSITRARTYSLPLKVCLFFIKIFRGDL